MAGPARVRAESRRLGRRPAAQLSEGTSEAPPRPPAGVQAEARTSMRHVFFARAGVCVCHLLGATCGWGAFGQKAMWRWGPAAFMRKL
jgi:hypothetical protein